MDVCIVTEEYAGLNRGGRVGSAMRGLAETLRHNGDPVVVVLTDLSLRSESLPSKLENYPAPKFVFVSELAATDPDLYFPKSDASISYVVYKYIKSKQFEVVHFSDRLGAGFYSAMARRQGGIGACIVTHLSGGARWRRDANLVPPELEDFEREALERAQVENSDIVLSSSASFLSYGRQQGVVFRQSACINPLLPQWTKEIAQGRLDQPLSTRPLAEGQVRELVFLGAHERRKGFELFIEAVRQLPADVQPDLLFLGDFARVGAEYSGSYALRMLPHYGGRIRFMDDLDQEQTLEALARRRGALCVLPSPVENSPCTIAGCFTIGAPFVATHVGDVDPFIEAASRPFCLAAPDPSALAQAIAKAMREGVPALRSTLVPQSIAEEWRAWHKTLLLEQSATQSLATPLVSVCLTHYERPELLRRALEHLMRQTYQHLEIILVDDGSRHPLALQALDDIESANHRFPVRVVRSTNRYLGAARNLAASQAQGEYLLFHDDDNFAEPQEIETFVRAAQNSECDILTSCFHMFRDGKEAKARSNRKVERYPLGIGGTISFFHNRFGDANAFVRRTVFESLGGFTELANVGWEDWEFFLRAFMHGVKMGVVPEPLFNYRLSANGMHRTGNLIAYQERIYAAMERERPRLGADLLRFAKKEQQNEELRQRLLEIFEHSAGGELHRELLALEPGSLEARCKLSDLAFELGRCADAVEIGAADPAQRGKLMALAAQLERTCKRELRAESMVVPSATAGTPLLLLRGWAFTLDGNPHLPHLLALGDGFFQSIAKCSLARPDVLSHLKIEGCPKVGFAIAVVRSAKPFFLRSGTTLASSGRERIKVFDKTRSRFTGYVDEIAEFQIVTLRPPAMNWSGVLAIKTAKPSIVFIKNGASGFDACTDVPGVRARVTVEEGVSEVTVIIPADGETAVIFE
jgi:glycosyltransferase involved in cell wall biosynthesis